jgi:hypothetical protein
MSCCCSDAGPCVLVARGLQRVSPAHAQATTRAHPPPSHDRRYCSALLCSAFLSEAFEPREPYRAPTVTGSARRGVILPGGGDLLWHY